MIDINAMFFGMPMALFRRWPSATAAAPSSVAWGVAIVGFGLAGALCLALLCLAAAGGADAISGIFRATIWNGTIPDRLRGRLAGVEMISWSSGPLLGNAEAGFASALLVTCV